MQASKDGLCTVPGRAAGNGEEMNAQAAHTVTL